MSDDDRRTVIRGPAGRGGSRSGASPSIGPGTRLENNYELDAKLGGGGMGQVFRAHNIHTGIQSAIKVIGSDAVDDPVAEDLFKREARALASLRHDSIVNYQNFSKDRATNHWFLVMELLEGEDLEQYIKPERHGLLNVDEAFELLRRVARGLHAAHTLRTDTGTGLVHRDISPDNIFLVGGRVDQAKVIDFGIVRGDETAIGRTVIGATFAGKYDYASPEQLGIWDTEAGRTEVGPASDIYSLALVMVQALTGRTIRRRESVPDLKAIDPRMRPLLEWMLEPAPHDRPPSMQVVELWQPSD